MVEINNIAKKHDLIVIEDACQAHEATYKGKKAGSMGDLGCFSFYPTKNLGAFGDGGAVVTNSQLFAEKVRYLADHGQSSRYQHQQLGTNSRLDSLQAAALQLKLGYLDTWNDKRVLLARSYDHLLDGIVRTPVVAEGNAHVYHLYVIATDERDRLRAFLEAKGISTMIHYPIPIHAQPAFRQYQPQRAKERLPCTSAVVNRILSLPLYPGMKTSDVHRICRSIHAFFEARR